MAYIKNCNPGKITMDLPRANYIYELPLLSFSDIHGSMNLSLLFNYQLYYNQTRATDSNVYVDKNFFVMPGYKLNVLKYLKITNGYPEYLIDSTGNRVDVVDNGDYPFGFNDNSQSVLYRTSVAGKPYVIVYPDTSMEYYNANGMIVSVVNKYSDEVLRLNYNASNGRLTNIIYRNSKNIQISYSSSGKINKVTYSDAGCATQLVYYANYIEVQHYSGETCKVPIFTSNSETGFYANLIDPNYKIDIVRNGDSFVISNYIDNIAVNTTTYKFIGFFSNPNIQHDLIDVTNNEDVKTRMQYQYGKLTCSYELIAQNNENEFSVGTVYVHKTIENAENGVSGKIVSYRQGVSGATQDNLNNQVKFDISSYMSSCSRGRFVLTGWIKREINAPISTNDTTIRVLTDYNGSTMKNFTFSVPDDEEWRFFAYTFYANVNTLVISLPTNESLHVSGLRLSHERIDRNVNASYFDIESPEYVLISQATSGCKHIPISEASFVYRRSINGTTADYPLSQNGTVCFEDLFRFKLNKKMNVSLSEVYANKGKMIVDGDQRGTLIVTYTDPDNNITYTDSVDQCDLGICHYTQSGAIVTRIRDNVSGALLTYETVCTGENHVTKTNNYLDIVAETENAVTTTTTRNKDLVTKVEVKDSSNSTSNTFTKTTAYGTDEAGNVTITETDEFGQQIMCVMDSIWGNIKSVNLYKNGTWQMIVADEYDSDMCALEKRIFGNASGRFNKLTYADGNISAMETGSLTYGFAYNQGKLSAVSKNSSNVEKHVHTGNTKTQSFYPDNSSALHSTVTNFDKYGNMTSIDGVLEIGYKNLIQFNGNTPTYGTPTRDCFAKTYKDKIAGENANLVHDITGTVIRKDVKNTATGALKSQETFDHDGVGRLTKDLCKYNATSNQQVVAEIGYIKGETDPMPDNRIQTYRFTANGSISATTTNVYDTFKRVNYKSHAIGNKTFTKEFFYEKTRVNRVEENYGGATTYEYDVYGRVSKITTGGKAITYHYDAYGQLVREDNKPLDATFVYAYNNVGNLTSVKKYAYTTSTSSPSGTPAATSFGYTADKLTTFGGATIAYNSMGCPTTYEGKNLTWSKGKLSRMFSGTLATGTSSYNYTYNAFGQRVSRTYSYLPGNSSAVQIGQLTEYNKSYYYDHAGRLISENVSKTYYSAGSTSESIVFLYDESGIIGMARTVGSTTNAYYFQRNLLGDVVAIYDTNGNMVAKYLYDAWGNCTVSSETTNTVVANANPIRYRGYYYDDDTGLYYLNARYYSPKWRRFISPDDTAYLDPDSVNGLNLYCYCGNDPVNYVDPSGCFPVLACILGLTALIGIGLTIGGVASDSNLMTAIGLTMVAIPALISGGIAAFATTGALAIGIGIGTMIAGAGTGLFAWAEYQEAFSGNNWMLDAGMSEEWYTGLMFTTAGLATLGTFASGFAYSFNIHSINKVGTLEGTNYKGIRFTQKVKRLSGKKAKLYRTLEWHTHSHMGYKPHWQMNAFSNNGGIWIRGKALSRWSWWLTKI